MAGHRNADRVGLLRNTNLAHGAIAILALPGYMAMFFFVHTNGRLLEGLDWIPPVTVERLTADISSVYLQQISSPISWRPFPDGIPFIGSIVTMLAVLGLVYLWRKRIILNVLMLATMVLPLTLLAISLVLPLWLPRYLLWGAISFFIIAGLGIAALPQRAQFLAAALVGTLCFVNLIPYYGIEGKPRWDLAAASVEPAIQNQDLILVADVWVPRMMNVYLSRTGVVLSQGQWTSDVSVALSRLAEGGRVWAVFGRVGQVDREDVASSLRRISVLGSPVTELRVGLDIVILRFDPQVALTETSKKE
jgi:mannosyltransferase